MASESSEISLPDRSRSYRLVDFASIVPVACPCGTARRALADEPAFPGSLHLTTIRGAAQPHYHRRLTETYYILSCAPGSRIRLDDDHFELSPGMAIVIPPGVVHAVEGEVELLNIVVPEFDAADEFLVDTE